MNNHKIKKELIFYDSAPLAELNFDAWLRDICHTLDIPTPIILPTHYRNFCSFHNAKFKQDDFVEALDYDMFVVEDCKQD
ncbi:MAG: hypothetical protein RR348_00420 [Clostridia bacterium]